MHFSSPAPSKQVIFLLWKVAHCSFDIKDRSSLFSLKAAIGEVKLYYADLSEGYNIIQRNDVKHKLLSSTFPTSPARRFQDFSALVCSRHSLELGVFIEGSDGVCGAQPTASPAFSEVTWCWELFSGQVGGRRAGLGQARGWMRKTILTWFLRNMGTPGPQSCGVADWF